MAVLHSALARECACPHAEGMPQELSELSPLLVSRGSRMFALRPSELRRDLVQAANAAVNGKRERRLVARSERIARPVEDAHGRLNTPSFGQPGDRLAGVFAA